MSGSSSSIIEDNLSPVAIITPGEQEAVVGSIVKLDARASYDPQGAAITYLWLFKEVPIGSQVKAVGFTDVESDSSVVNFAPDVIGRYQIQLVVNDGSLNSGPAVAEVDTRIILVPHHKGITPDASFIWRYLSDFWKLVQGRMRFETFWSAAIQIVASETLRLYQIDYNKSIKDIQTLFQRRWLAYEPGLELDKTKYRFILADDQAGAFANTLLVDPDTGIPIEEKPNYTNVVSIPTEEGDFVTTSYGKPVAKGRLVRVAGRSFTMRRSRDTSRTLNYNFVDGAVNIGDNIFHGSAFTAELVDKTILVFAPSSAEVVLKTYKISSFITSATIGLVELDGTPIFGTGLWPATFTGLSYSVLNAEPDTSNFYADLDVVPGNLQKQFWRFSSTLVSDEFDFEEQGVRPGDLLDVEVALQETGAFSTVSVQVVSVDRNRLGFLFNVDDLVEGVAAPGISNEIQFKLASDLRIPGMVVGNAGEPVYTLAVLSVRNALVSPAFRRDFFEAELTTESVITAGPVSFTLRPLRVVRNSTMRMDDRLVSAPVLQEYIKEPEINEDNGKLIQQTSEGPFELARMPFTLIENLDYIIDDETMIRGVCDLTAFLNEITIPFGDLVDRSITEGDTLTVDVGGATPLVFDIEAILSSEKLRVFPTPTFNKTGVPFKLTRLVGGRFLRFTKDIFTKKKPAPTRLWAEVSYFDNNDVVENNFGVLVGVSEEQFESKDTGTPYKSGVAGLMFALTGGPTIANLQLSAHILLGLPFSENAGVITEIDPDFKKYPDGSPKIGRILVEARDKFDKPIGLTNIYLYPQGLQRPDPDNPGQWLPQSPELSGLAINPDTGVEYVVGDRVAQFTALSKGVSIRDYITVADWFRVFVDQGDPAPLVQKYHTFQLIINTDVVSTEGVDFAGEFIKKAKAHYTRLRTTLFRLLEDDVDIDDDLTLRVVANLFDNPSLSLPTALKMDHDDFNDAYISVNGIMYQRVITGDDLTTFGVASSVVESLAGGFIDPRIGENMDFPRMGDQVMLVIYGSPNAGKYVVDTSTDTELLLVSDVLTAATNQSFVVYRPIQAQLGLTPDDPPANTRALWFGHCNGLIGTNELTVDVPFEPAYPGIWNSGVSVGDLLIVFGPSTSFRSTITKLEIEATAPVTPNSQKITIKDLLPFTVDPTRDVAIFREPLLITNQAVASASFGPDPNVLTFDISSVPSMLILAALRRGDVLFRQSNSVGYTVLDVYVASDSIYVTPGSAPSAVESFDFTRPGRASTPISADLLDRIPGDHLSLRLFKSTPDLTRTIGLFTVSTVSGENFTTLGIMPGDLLEIEGEPSDFGYGVGVFPIAEVSGTTMKMTRPASATGTTPYAIQRRRERSEPENALPSIP